MARPGGNPDFGTKYKFDYGREEPLSASVYVMMYPKVKNRLKELALKKKCSVPDLVRTALDEYLDKVEEKNTA